MGSSIKVFKGLGARPSAWDVGCMTVENTEIRGFRVWGLGPFRV